MQPYVKAIYDSIISGNKLNRNLSEKIALQYGIVDKNTIKELCELAIVFRTREIANQRGQSDRVKFYEIVNLYNSQVNLSHRTSHSIILQQYSTPAPIAFLCGAFVRQTGNDRIYFEPCAGNGLLTTNLPIEQTWVNEIDNVRSKNLSVQNYARQLKVDASEPFQIANKFDGIITNPPFGKLPHPTLVNGFPITQLDHLMVIHALNCMKDNGKAALIIGGHTNYDEKGRIKAGKNRIFLSFLYRFYNVVDAINVDGSLYSRQGTSFDVRLILIQGRKKMPGGFPPLKNTNDRVITDFFTLYDRVFSHIVQEQRLVTAKVLARKKLKELLIA